MWEQVKLAVVESAREVCGSVRVGGGGKEPKESVWNDEVKTVVKYGLCNIGVIEPLSILKKCYPRRSGN